MKNYNESLDNLTRQGSMRSLPNVEHYGKLIVKDEVRMLNVSSNDYLGLASRDDLRLDFFDNGGYGDLPLSSSSSRLLTGNFKIYYELENSISKAFGREAALLFNSGYHANTGILPALADKNCVIIADKLVHASIIDGIRLGEAPFRRYRHNDYDDLERLVAANKEAQQIFVVTESVFSMDGDVADLRRLVDIKHRYPNVMLYVDEAHAIGVRGKRGLGLAEETDCIAEIDLLVGTFGKALASMGAYVVCSDVIKKYLINTMRPLIFSTALPPLQIAWTKYIFDKLEEFQPERDHLEHIAKIVREAAAGHGGEISASHIVPFIVGENEATIAAAETFQKKGFYVLPVRPPTVPKGTSRLRFSLTAAITEQEALEIATIMTKQRLNETKL